MINILNSSFNGVSLFKERILPEFSSRNKRITLIAIAIISYGLFCLTAYWFFKCRKTRHIEDPQKLEKKDDPQKLEKQEVQEKPEKEVEEQADPTLRTMTIFLKTRTEEEAGAYKVSESDTIHSFKELIYERRKDYLVEQIRLVWNGRQLEDCRTFADYQIQNKSIIHLVNYNCF